MRFLDPDAGEMLDRLTVLARKKLEKPERAHFAAEEEALLAHWGKGGRVISGTHLLQVLRLSAVNMAIWETETGIREARKYCQEAGYEFYTDTPHMRILALLAVRLQVMNEERARLVQFFNEALGAGAVEEKDFKL